MCNYHNEEIIGYCIYCKNEIEVNTTYIIHNEQLYHVECYTILEQDVDAIDFGKK